MSIIKYYNLNYADVFIFDHYVINQIHEGVAIDALQHKRVNEIIQKHFSGKDMVYISNRIKSYSVDPLIYPRMELIPNLLAIAIVPKTLSMKKSAEFEGNFYDKPFEIFDTLSEAIKWADGISKKSD